MNQKTRSKLNWRNVIGTLAIGLGAITSIDASAMATPIKDNFQLAQVGVQSRINSPTPLNLRPRTHIPLPQSNYSHYPRYNSGYGNYDRRHSHQGNRHHTHHRHTHHHRHRNRSTVIIIRPGGHSSMGNYGNGNFIRSIQY